MDSNITMDITPINCSCGRNLGCANYLGKYVVFCRKNKLVPENQLCIMRKLFFTNDLKLDSKCCWKSLQTYFDPVEIALMSDY